MEKEDEEQEGLYREKVRDITEFRQNRCKSYKEDKCQISNCLTSYWYVRNFRELIKNRWRGNSTIAWVVVKKLKN